MNGRSLRYPLGLAAVVSLLVAAPAFAGRGGFHGGGGGFHGGGGGFHGGGGGFHPGGGGGFHPGGGFNPGGFRPGGRFHPAPGFHAPGAGPHVENFNRFGGVNNRAFEANRFNNANVNRFNNFNNVNVNRFNNFGNVNRFNNFNNLGWRGPYAGYHSNWVHGYWNGHYYPGWWGGYGGGWGGGYGGGFGPFWGWGLGGFGLGMLTGLGAYGLGSSLYNWGYMPYTNPYYGYGLGNTAVVAQAPMAAVPYNYAQPIDTTAPAADQAATDAAMQTFQSARDAFKAGDYKQALALTDQAIKGLPNDVTLHEFRALALFALGQYDQAAAPLYAVLSMGPGWDWSTLAGLYPSVDVYTAQLRALEDFVQQHPDSAAAHFVLAYHYLTQGHTDAAVGQLQRVAQLQPGDKLSAQILQQLTRKDEGANPTGPPPQDQPQPQPLPASSNAPQGNLVGNWTASPAKDTNITLNVAPDGNFTWKVSGQGPARQLTGTSTYGNGILTLAQSQGQGQGQGQNPEQGQSPPPLVGHVTWQDPNRFTFQVAGGPNDPGLTFSRSN